MLGIRLRVWVATALLVGATGWLALDGAPGAPPAASPTSITRRPDADPASPVAADARSEIARGAASLEPASPDGAVQKGTAPATLHPAVRETGASPPPAPADSELMILEEEAARAALRRGVPNARTLAEPARAAAPGSDSADVGASEPARRSLADEFLIDHLVADVYRTTIFPRNVDAIGESRDAAWMLLRVLGPDERRALLREALADTEAPPRPKYHAKTLGLQSDAIVPQ